MELTINDMPCFGTYERICNTHIGGNWIAPCKFIDECIAATESKK